MEIKLPSSRTPSYRSVPLAANSTLDGEICIALPLTLSRFEIFKTEDPAPLYSLPATLAIPGLRIRLSMVLLLQERAFPYHLFYVIPSRLGVPPPRWWKSTHLDDFRSHSTISQKCLHFTV
ncbi:hypothetical protein TNCV_2963311 [Trichonephila clavipes]|nr:hypothetical protein TNCV_2963311 [Trichonephila clavipes]